MSTATPIPDRPIRNGYGLRLGPCRRPGCKRRVPKSSICASYCCGACQVAAWRARNEPRPVLTLACEAGCGVTFTTRSTVKRHCSDLCKRRAFDRRRYWRNAKRQEPHGCNRARALARSGGAA